MGFSVSGATALLFVAFLIAFGTFYSATMGAVEQVQEAQVETQEGNVETLNTAINITTAEYNSTQGELTIIANNTGAEPLQPLELSLLVSGNYTGFGQANVSITDSPADELWAPQEQLTLTIGDNDLPATPADGDTAKLVTVNEVAATEQIRVVN
ncbi:fla cluster protein FlaF [Halovenus sp. WSH3]|uniref:Fla cluster protein FlaF n=1 Tax=Halovenus carboxidivorans TaxID=2692199 RepID=A0A6B0T3R5_9EURY|nr:fla cluster protein FlaF [Halovenus carboxidivorans]MXR52714.1 fla cluster protein FlaF [Halovenus carboxidivorans]